MLSCVCFAGVRIARSALQTCVGLVTSALSLDYNLQTTVGRVLQRLENRAPRGFSSPSYDTSAKYLFEVLGSKNLDFQYQIAQAVIYDVMT